MQHCNCTCGTDGDPSNYLSYYRRATVYLALGRSRPGLQDLDEVIRLKPDFTSARAQRGGVLVKLGRLEEAHIDLENVVMCLSVQCGRAVCVWHCCVYCGRAVCCVALQISSVMIQTSWCISDETCSVRGRVHLPLTALLAAGSRCILLSEGGLLCKQMYSWCHGTEDVFHRRMKKVLLGGTLVWNQ